MRVNTCETCGEDFTKPHNPQRVYKYCSMACMGNDPVKRQAHSEAMAGRYKTGQDRECEQCGESFYAPVYKNALGWGRHCSQACAAKGTGLRRRGVPLVNGGTFKAGDPRMAEMNRQRLMGKKGPLSIAWRGGKTDTEQLIRGSKEYKQWRLAVFRRDNFTCQGCGDRNERGRGARVVLNADHIKPFAYFPELRFDLDNGRTLCLPCHKATDTYAGKAQRHDPSLQGAV